MKSGKISHLKNLISFDQISADEIEQAKSLDLKVYQYEDII